MDTRTLEEISCPLREPEPGSRESARTAGLVIVADCYPGIRRERTARGFRYRRDDGEPISGDDLARIERLKVPPAWTDVWICGDERGHVQATGRDVRGRKQYRYHERWQATREETKYERMTAFGEALPAIRAAVDRDLRRPKVDRERVLALAVAVLDRTLVRVGNSEYARDNESYGLTTLRDEHAEVGATAVRLRFRGKAGKELEVALADPRVARALRKARDLPGQELLQYLDEGGQVHVIGSGDVNEYLREVSGTELTSKDFRTWGGSLVFALALRAAEGQPGESEIVSAVKQAADALHNTPAVCRRSYIHPGLIELHRSGAFEDGWSRAAASEDPRPYLSEQERVFLGLLRDLEGQRSRAT